MKCIISFDTLKVHDDLKGKTHKASKLLRKKDTVEQEIFTTGNFREIAASGGSRQENFAIAGLEDLPSFKMSPCLLKSDHY